MTETDVTKVLLFLSANYGRQFDYPSGDEGRDALKVQVWHDQLKGHNKTDVEKAVKVFISEGHQWPPNPGQIIALLRKMNDPQGIPGVQAWHLLIRAIQRHGLTYGLENIKKEVPPEVWETSVLVGLDRINNSGDDDTYLMTHFIKTHEQQSARKKERELYCRTYPMLGEG